MEYSEKTLEALVMLGNLIKLKRKTLKMTEVDLAEKTGISRTTIQRIEKGSPTKQIGFVFEAATAVGVNLFHDSEEILSLYRESVENKIALLPQRVRESGGAD